MVTPIGYSYRPGRSQSPDSENSLVPVDASVPMPANQSPPFALITATQANVSTLFTTVGHFRYPWWTGSGHRRRGMPRRPSMLLSIAVSIPQMYAPAPKCTSMSKSSAVPRMFVPSSPSARRRASTASRWSRRYQYSCRT